MAQTRLLTEYRLRPILRRGGIAAPRGDSFCVYRGRDTRYQLVGWVSPHIIGRLGREGQLSAPEDFPERIIWRRGASPDPVVQAVRPPLDKVNVPGQLRGLAHDWLTATERAREKAAAGRYQDEFTRASQPTGAGRERANPRERERRALPPAQRLAALESDLGTVCMRQLEDLIIDRATESALCVRWGMEAETVRAIAGTALMRLARAYELVPAAESPA
ncbi:MAG TPA: hypothetical protein DDY28_07150 [Hyphomonas atlantica]|nr:hypothetical protein [Hyphomonas atlantica]